MCVHRPVLGAEAVGALLVREDGTYIDGTVGGGGHAALILELLGEKGRLIGIDRDAEALARAERRLERWKGRFALVHADFADMTDVAAGHGVSDGGADGVLLDLGVSSDQLEAPERGFSFMRDGPLDMRMDNSAGATAADLINEASPVRIEELIREYGEEREAGRIARAIADERLAAPIVSTVRLADIVARAKRERRGRIHPATRTFQALRIAVNGELDSLGRGLESGLRLLRPGGRMAVISFHSLEDRLVKRTFSAHAGAWEAQQAGGRLWRGMAPRVRLVNKRVLKPGQDEIAVNARSRSARLRVVERIAEEA